MTEYIMSPSRTKLFCLAISMALAACTPDPGPEKPTPLPPVKDTVFGDMAGAVDQARSVEATTMQQKQEMDRALEDAEGR
jgi:hypothetical protein